MDFLPTEQHQKLTPHFQLAKSYIAKFFADKSNRYKLGIVLDVICLTLLVLNGVKPAVRIISPFINSIQTSVAQFQMKYDTFAFIPSSAPNKYDNVSFDRLGTLAFFDIPIDDDGTLYQGRGLSSLQSGATADLFARAHAHGTKVAITFSAGDPGTIQNILADSNKQQTFINQAIAQIKASNADGLVLDLEYTGDAHQSYRDRYNTFISNLTTSVHNQIPNSTVAIAVPGSTKTANGIYDLAYINKTADKVFVMANTFAVPEDSNNSPKAPVYGYTEQDYWKTLGSELAYVTQNISSQKMVVETAWYGNGDNYPLYIPNSKPATTTTAQAATPVALDQQSIDRLVQGVPNKAKESARRNIPLIAKALQDEGILDSNVLAYALATIEHETDATFEPISEIQGDFSARRLGYEGGEAFYGRGFIQLTHLRNYRMIGERIGMGDQLVRNPELASNPEVAAKILAAFFKDNNVANLASQGLFEAARQPINPDRNGYRIALLAWKYE